MPHTILLTGAGSGIGRDAALALAKRGHRVIATTRTQEQADTLAEATHDLGITLETAKLDITDADDIANAARRFEPDVLVNNAAIGESGPMTEVPLDRVRHLLDVNVVGTLAVTQAFAPRMLQAKRGRIVIVGSTAGRVVLPYLGPYHLSKYAIEAMGDALRLELGRRGIKVALIEPGLILTGFNERMADTKYAWLKPDSAYAKDISKMKKHDASLPSGSSNTEEVVAAIIDAIESRHPKTRYVAPKKYERAMLLAKLAPDWLRDRAVKKFAGL